MKIVQSYWSKPSLEALKSDFGRHMGGWNSQKYHFYSWALSCLSIKKQYNEIELITDAKGKSLLIDKIGLPYAYVKICLDDINNYHRDLFALGKIVAYSIQEGPFLHLDSDVYLWDRFSVEIENSLLVSQNKELDFNHDKATLAEVTGKFSYIPDEVMHYLNEAGLWSSNAGVFGGTDIDFFKNYTKEVFKFIDQNTDRLKELTSLPLFNIIYEQYLFTVMARYKNVNINYVFKNLDANYMRHFCSFDKVPDKVNFLHIIGPYKKLRTIEIALENRLLLEYPEYYYRIEELFENEGL